MDRNVLLPDSDLLVDWPDAPINLAALVKGQRLIKVTVIQTSTQTRIISRYIMMTMVIMVC
jgi:hypothetical protein